MLNSSVFEPAEAGGGKNKKPCLETQWFGINRPTHHFELHRTRLVIQAFTPHY